MRRGVDVKSQRANIEAHSFIEVTKSELFRLRLTCFYFEADIFHVDTLLTSTHGIFIVLLHHIEWDRPEGDLLA